MELKALRNILETKAFDQLSQKLYKKDETQKQRKRYLKLLTKPEDEKGDFRLFSVPGRTELSGNHTDHNLGMILAASIDLDSLALVRPVAGNRVRVLSQGYEQPFEVDLNDLSPQVREKGRTEALIRGVAASIKRRGGQIGGFEAWLDGRVFPGSGLSSSASIEVLLGSIFNELYNNGSFDYIQIAQMGQEAENQFFGKPCGLMDQLACAAGGVVFVDFADKSSPVVERMEVSFLDYGYALAVVNTGGSHADLTDHYAAIPREMKAVASYWDKETLRGVTNNQLLDKGPLICKELGIRPFLRSLHFINENFRVLAQKRALLDRDIKGYMALAAQSGQSSFESLQNCMLPDLQDEQEIPLALSLSLGFLKNLGAARIHGGGFAGTIQVYLPVDRISAFSELMIPFFGSHSVATLQLRNYPAGPLDFLL